MRKTVFIGVPLLVVIGLLYLLLRPGDPLVNARRLMARGDMKGAELYLLQAVHADPGNPDVAFRMGEVDLALGNLAGAELELRRARAQGYNPAAIIQPLGLTLLRGHHDDEILRDFQPDTVPPGGRAMTLDMRAEALLALNRVDEAALMVRQAEQADPHAGPILLTAARVALAGGDMAAAAARVDQILAHDANQPDALVLRAELALRAGHPQASLADARQVLQTNPTRLDARMMQARALTELGQTDAARAAIGQVLRAQPTNVAANFLGAVLALQARDAAAADRMLARITTRLSSLPRGFYLLAAAKLGIGQPALAEEAIGKFLAQSPEDVPGLTLATAIALARHRPDHALALLDSPALAAHPDATLLDLAGRTKAMQGDLKAARQDFTDAITLAPGDVKLLNRLAATDLSLGDLGQAAAPIASSLRIDPDQPVAAAALVSADLARGDLAAARTEVAHLRQAAEQAGGDSEEAGVLDAQIKMAALDMTGAAAELRATLRRYPESRAATLNLVRLEGLDHHPEAAEKLLLALLARHPDDQAALEILLPALFLDHRPERAIGVAEASHLAAPDNVAITLALAQAYVRAGMPDRAVALLDRVNAGRNPGLDFLKARILALNGQPARAEKAYRAVLAEAPGDAQPSIELAGLLAAAKRYDEAADTLHAALASHPGDILVMHALVRLNLMQGGIKAALAAAAALRADPHNLPAANRLAGDAWVEAGHIAQAASAYLAAYTAAPDAVLALKSARALATIGQSPSAISLLAHWTQNHPGDLAALSTLGLLYQQADRLPDAAGMFEAVLRAAPRDVMALNNLALIRQRAGDLNSAKSLAQRAYFIAPSPEIADTLGWILARMDDLPPALRLLEQASAIEDPSARASALYHYAAALKQSGDNAAARHEAGLALSMKVNFPERAAAARILAEKT